MTKPQYSGPWTRIRLEVLERDGYLCQIRDSRCKGTATQVDHIVPVTSGGAWWDKANLRAACWPCNRDRVKGAGSDRWKRSTTQIVLVVGPPGAGKRAHVDEHRRPDDLVIDYDALAAALGSGESSHRSVMAARNGVLNSVRRGECDARRVWIISANPKAESLFPYHERIVIDDPDVDDADGWRAARAGTVLGPAPDASRDWFGTGAA